MKAPAPPEAQAAPRVLLSGWDNGVGLSRDLTLLSRALEEAGLPVVRGQARPRGWRRLVPRALRGPGPRYGASIMLEHVDARRLPLARRNFFIPNPEWCLWGDLAQLDGIDAILVKTGHAAAIFGGHGHVVRSIGFTSEDRHDPAVPRERAFFHLAGSSCNKGTERLMALWRRHPEWPLLTVVQNPKMAKRQSPEAANIRHRIDHLDDAELRTLQNAHRFHLCTSETEGWGHYLVEAMSVGAVTLTVDAPPMNELVTSERGLLVAWERSSVQNMATTYFFDEQALEAAVSAALTLADDALDRIGGNARSWFLRNDRGFGERVRNALLPLL